MRRGISVLLILFGALAAKPAKANLLITIGDATIAPGGTGYVDVEISGANDPLALAGFEFLITPISGNSVLSFADPQSDSQLNHSVPPPAYVFYGDSSDYKFSSAVGSVSGAQDDTFIGSDGTDDGKNVSVTSPVLLERLDLTHSYGAADPSTTIGDTFQISLVDESNTFFYDADSNPINYSSTSGTVTILGANVVPEPGTCGMMLAGVAGLVLARRKRRRFSDQPTC